MYRQVKMAISKRAVTHMFDPSIGEEWAISEVGIEGADVSANIEKRKTRD